MILLDTNVLSELIKPHPSNRVVSWISNQPATSLFISTITQAEILYGIAILAEGKRKQILQETAMDMFSEDFSGRILPFDVNAGIAYAEIALSRHLTGRPISQFDAQIAAIARSRGGDIATRNIKDFQECGIKLINPWEE